MSSQRDAEKRLKPRNTMKTKESERLLEENKRMEFQLHKLRSQIERERAKIPQHDGPIWKSSASSGSLRSFAQEVRSTKQSKSGQREKASSTKKRQETSDKEKRVLRGSQAGQWSVDDVTAWLESIGLSQCKEAFRENEINGEVLLEIGVDDLDYMGITSLGPRKVLLKEVTKLKRCALTDADTIRPMTPRSTGLSARQSSSDAQVIHVKANYSPDNYAKKSLLEETDLDEEGEHEAFRKAVEEWRNGKVAPNSTREASSMKNAEVNVERSVKAKYSPQKSESFDCSGNLMKGTLDEEAEHLAFKSAVEEWRKGGVDKPIKVITGSKGLEVACKMPKGQKDKLMAQIVSDFEESLRNSKCVYQPMTNSNPQQTSPYEGYFYQEEKKLDSVFQDEINLDKWNFEAAF